MGYKMRNYAMANVTHDALDKGHGVQLVAAAESARIVLAASCFAVTNTTNCVPIMTLLPGPEGFSAGSVDLNTYPSTYILKSSQPLNGALATPYTPATLVPYIESRAGGGTFPIIPPGYILVGAMGDVDGDGSVAWQVVTAEIDA
jgi:hypothetical protein